MFYDTEHAHLSNAITFPFATRVITPECYRTDIGEKQIRYAGYQELAYLHPDRFQPDPGVLDELGFTSNEPYFVVRLVSWKASHDIGQRGVIPYDDITQDDLDGRQPIDIDENLVPLDPQVFADSS